MSLVYRLSLSPASYIKRFSTNNIIIGSRDRVRQNKEISILRPAVFVKKLLQENNKNLQIHRLDRQYLGKYLKGKKLIGLDIGESKYV